MGENKILSRDDLRELLLDSGQMDEGLERVLDQVERFNELKQSKGAIVLAHYYMRDAIKFGIADYIGDSLELSLKAKGSDADIVVFCGVNFMAETAKILNPQSKVLLPSLEAGCSLAESITGNDVKELKRMHPDAAVVTYVNTTADVKAESDICVTSANAKRIVAGLEEKKIIFIPDKYMARNIAIELPDKEFIEWDGRCIVHEQFTAAYFEQYRARFPGIRILSHYECDSSVISASDMHGGTSDIRRYIRDNDAPAYLIATECGLASTIKADFPAKNIVGPCNICPYMKKITVSNALDALVNEKPEIIVPEEMRIRAYASIDRMLRAK